MKFSQALLDRYGCGGQVQRLWGGGFAGGGGWTGGIKGTNGLPGFVDQMGDWGTGIAKWASNRDPTVAPQIHDRINAPVNTFQANAPSIQGADYSGSMHTGMQGVNSAQGRLGDVYGNQMATAQNAGQTIGGLQGLYGQQQNLAAALQAQSMGQGPNPAQAQFQQNMNQAIAQNAGTLSSQRGINPALAAHLAQQQGAAMGQGAAGQAATLQAQQQIAAQQALGQQQQAMGANLMNQNNVYNTQGGLYGQAANTAGAGGQLGANIYGTAMGGLGQYNNASTTGQLGAMNANAGVAQQNADNNLKAQLGQAGISEQNLQAKSKSGGIAGGVIGAIGAAAMTAAASHGAIVKGEAKYSGDDPRNDTVKALLSPGEIVVPRSAAKSPEKAMEFIKAIKKWDGSKVDSYGKVLGHKKEIAELKKKLAALEKKVGKAS